MIQLCRDYLGSDGMGMSEGSKLASVQVKTQSITNIPQFKNSYQTNILKHKPNVTVETYSHVACSELHETIKL